MIKTIFQTGKKTPGRTRWPGWKETWEEGTARHNAKNDTAFAHASEIPRQRERIHTLDRRPNETRLKLDRLNRGDVVCLNEKTGYRFS